MRVNFSFSTMLNSWNKGIFWKKNSISFVELEIQWNYCTFLSSNLCKIFQFKISPKNFCKLHDLTILESFGHSDKTWSFKTSFFTPNQQFYNLLYFSRCKKPNDLCKKYFAQKGFQSVLQITVGIKSESGSEKWNGQNSET